MPKQLNLTDNLEQYIIDNSESLTEVQKEIIEYNISLGDQKRLQISVSQAQLLQTLIKTSGIKKILEIGSFTGFSALSMALALPSDGSLISLDKNSEFSKKAKVFYEKANENKIVQIIKPALESLNELKNSKKIYTLLHFKKNFGFVSDTCFRYKVKYTKIQRNTKKWGQAISPTFYF